MDTAQQINKYQALIIEFLSEQQDPTSNTEEYRRIMLADKEHRHYQLIATGWASPSQYIDAILIHIAIKPTGKVWLLENSTELHVAEELVARGINKTDIVLAFHPPQYRTLSGYAAA